MFTKAQKSASSIKILISGASGSGKTYSALAVASGLAGKTALLDTEGQSSLLYADKFDFDIVNESDPRGYPPEFFIKVINAAERAGYRNLIIDSITHEWKGKGGCIDIVDQISNDRKGFNAWSAVTPRHRAFIDAILRSSMNIICTVRRKVTYSVEKDVNGKTFIKKLGLEPEQRDGIEYEFGIHFEIDQDSHIANASKDITELFGSPILITQDAGRLIKQWISGVQIKPECEENVKAASNPDQSNDEKYTKALAFVSSEIEALINSGLTSSEVSETLSSILGYTFYSLESINKEDLRQLANELYRRKNVNV